MEQSSTHLRGLLQSSEGAVGATAVSYAPFDSMAGISIPSLSSSQEITAEWLNKVLQGGDRTISEVASFTMSPFMETDYDCTVRLDLSYARASADARPGPASLLCKISRAVPTPKWSESIADFCHRETAAYVELKYHDVCRMPALLFSAVDSRGYTFLLQEDSGALPISQNTPDTSTQMDAVLRELASLHGSFARHSPVSAPRWLLKPRDSAELIAEHYREGVGRLLAKDGNSQLSADHWQLIEEFSDRIVAWHRFDRHILTITHGDVRSENMLYQGQGAACRATLVGWKLAGLRNPMFDVASLLSNSLTIEERRDSEMIWLERYRRQFEQSGTSYAGIDAHADYRFHLFAPLIFNVCAAAFAGESAARSIALKDNIARNCQAILDWNALSVAGIQSVNV
jgi:thiamine kinase-like enzyme